MAEICLKVLKMLIERRITPDKNQKGELDKEIEEHLKGCKSCRMFMEKLQIK